MEPAINLHDRGHSWQLAVIDPEPYASSVMLDAMRRSRKRTLTRGFDATQHVILKTYGPADLLQRDFPYMHVPRKVAESVTSLDFECQVRTQNRLH